MRKTFRAGHLARGGRLDLTKRGEQAPWSKLDEAAVREIRESAESGAELARKFGVSGTTISRVRRGETWRA